MVGFTTIIWDDEEEEGNVAHIAEHGFDPEDIDFVLRNPMALETSKSSGRPCVFGYTPDGDYIIVIYDEVDADTVYPVTAYEVPEP